MFEVKRPTKQVEIVTDLDTLTQAMELKKQIDESTPKPGTMTDAEICAAKRTTDKLRKDLKAKLKVIDESTVTITLRGLNSSRWNQIITEITTTDVKTGRQERDFNRLLQKALPEMIVSVTQQGEPIEWNSDSDVPALLDIIVDTQTAELLDAVQKLNTPQVQVPKAMRA